MLVNALAGMGAGGVVFALGLLARRVRTTSPSRAS
jgi:hypothetical protein